MTRDDFIEKHKGIYEHSPWIAAAAFDAGKTGSIEEIYAVMRVAVTAAAREKQLALICAHPDLACAPADLTKLTDASISEQKGAGLNQCTPEEFSEFQQLNRDYREKFGFPFIIAVKGLTRHDILLSFRARINNTSDDEFKTALEQIHRIAGFRLQALYNF
jgi:2-oxo-4-hydroxy-4-carboxy-5-ureidoimidazoline decarboxylase